MIKCQHRAWHVISNQSMVANILSAQNQDPSQGSIHVQHGTLEPTSVPCRDHPKPLSPTEKLAQGTDF